MRPRRLLALVVPLLLAAPVSGDAIFMARTASGKAVRGPLNQLDADGSCALGKPVRRRIAAGDLLSLRRDGVKLPELAEYTLRDVGGQRGRLPVGRLH